MEAMSALAQSAEVCARNACIPNTTPDLDGVGAHAGHAILNHDTIPRLEGGVGTGVLRGVG